MGWGAPSICANSPGLTIAIILTLILVGAILMTIAYYDGWQWKLTLAGSALILAAIIIFTYCGTRAWFIQD